MELVLTSIFIAIMTMTGSPCCTLSPTLTLILSTTPGIGAIALLAAGPLCVAVMNLGVVNFIW